MEVLTRRRRVHRAQLDFIRTTALYRGFVGGRGAGKTWVGAYDLLTRARRGRTYLIASPTGVLLHDTTFPTFKALAQDVGVWGPVTVEHLPETAFTPAGDALVKMTPYPTVTLTTGATVRFRTAEDPEKLRGPNLSGVWLDEASLMHVEAYNVSIACLREQGSQGFLTATFTPKGLNHWTYETFGTGRPDTYLRRSDTRENPFNPPGFRDTLALQYSPQRQRQELGGEFVSMEGAEWPASYFPDSIWVAERDWPTHWRASALALDPALGEGERGRPPPSNRPPEPGCYAAFCFVGVDDRGVLWCDAWMSQQWDANQLVSMGFDLVAATGARAFSVETNGGQEFLAKMFLAEALKKNVTLPLYGIHNHEDKEVRIRSKLNPFLAQGRLRFRKGSPGAKQLVNQMRDFPVGRFKDGPDALQMGIVMADWMLGHKPGGAQPRPMRG